MADDNKKKKRSKALVTKTFVDEKQTKEEILIAKYLRSKLSPKEGKLVQMVVNIFNGNEAVNLLMESKWATYSDKRVFFSNRHHVVEFLKTMLTKNFFHRAVKVKKKSNKKVDEKVKKKSIAGVQTEDTKISKESKKTPVKKEGKKARVKLEVHDIQIFNPDDPDNDDVYVWIYEPFSTWKFLLGGMVLLVILVFCLFPIWPAHLRSVTYYGSMGCMGVIGLLVGLVVLRSIVFGLVWLATLGRHRLWVLPNLTEDCGVFESFKPLYEYKMIKIKKSKSKEKNVGNGSSSDANHDPLVGQLEVLDDEDAIKMKSE